MKKFMGLCGFLLAALMLLTGVRAYAATDWNSNVITVTGYGIAPPRAVNAAQARILARIAAKADAQRQLAEAINGVQVDASTTVEQMMVVSDTINTRVQATIKGARIVSENVTSDGAYEVTMEIPMFGESGGLAEAVFERPVEVLPFPTPEPVAPSIPQPAVRGGYTGLIIDCRGLGLNPVMSPVIKTSSGTKIYGHQNLDYDMVIRDGMASYASDMSQASRAGSNPLVIKAERLDDHNANPVISVTDGNTVLMENDSAGFLSRTAVVFLR